MASISRAPTVNRAIGDATTTPTPTSDFWAQTPEALANAAAMAKGAATTRSQQNAGMDLSGYDPELVAIYREGGLTPAGRGSGFADIAYWADKPSQWNRLRADIAGTGTDNPEGTPGQGPWLSSGRGGGGGGQSAPPTSVPMDSSQVLPWWATGQYADPSARLGAGQGALQGAAQAGPAPLNAGQGQLGFQNQMDVAAFNAGQGQQGYQNRYGQYADYVNWLNSLASRGVSAAQNPPGM